MRKFVYYVTIDDEDYLHPGHPRGAGHLPNITRLREIASLSQLDVVPIYMDALTEAHLEDKALLALFGAGSFPEWCEAIQNRVWHQRLDRYMALLRNMTVPMFAVCGSHQLVSVAFNGWDSVGHLPHKSTPPVTIAQEFSEGRGRIPNPRLCEVGIFSYQQVTTDFKQDRIFEGLPETLQLVQYHSDYVVPGQHSGFQNLLQPVENSPPVFWLTGVEGRINPTESEYCPVQMLRLKEPNRILYTTQFHPELDSGDAAVNQFGERLLTNFFEIAQEFQDAKSG